MAQIRAKLLASALVPAVGVTVLYTVPAAKKALLRYITVTGSLLAPTRCLLQLVDGGSGAVIIGMFNPSVDETEDRFVHIAMDAGDFIQGSLLGAVVSAEVILSGYELTP